MREFILPSLTMECKTLYSVLKLITTLFMYMFIRNIAVAWAGRLKLFDVRNKDPVIEYSQHCEGNITLQLKWNAVTLVRPTGIAITGVCYSPTGVHLAAALSNGNIGIFDGNHATPKPLFNLSPHKVCMHVL